MRHYVAQQTLYPELLSSIYQGLLRPDKFFITGLGKIAFNGLIDLFSHYEKRDNLHFRNLSNIALRN